MRIKKDIRAKESRINLILEKRGKDDKRILVNFDYGKPRVYQITLSEFEKSGGIDRELSFRRSTGEIYEWLDAFEAGLGF